MEPIEKTILEEFKTRLRERLRVYSDCAWEAGFRHGIVVVPVVFTQSEWDHGPERQSLFVRAVETEGVPV